MIATGTVDLWVALAVASGFAIWSAYGMFTYGPSVEKTQREWESAPRFVRYFIAFCTLGNGVIRHF
jgi:hypothetical protein